MTAAPRVQPVTRWAVAGVALAMAIVAALVWLDARRSDRELRESLAHELAAANARAAESSARVASLAAELREAQAKLALLDTRQAEAQTQQEALENFYRDLTPSRDEMALSELEQTLNLASQQLQLAGNVQSALTALQLADAKLARLDRPRFAPIRRALAADMEKLKAVPYVDVPGLAARLDAAIASVDGLPLAHDERVPDPQATPPAPPATGVRGFLRDLWTDLRGMIRIEVSDRPAEPLLAPTQQYFLRENLRLRLLSARNALIARNDASFRADIKAADAWVQKYFDTRAKPVQALNATLGQMRAVSLPATLPELSQSLAAAATLRNALDRAALHPGDAKPAPAAR